MNAIVTSMLLLGLTATGPQSDRARFNITSKKPDSAVEVRADKDKTLFIVKCPSGISQAVIKRQDDNWPKVMVLRMHLKGP
jgi:hypothetical protein